MIFFGHLGPTVAAVRIGEKILSKGNKKELNIDYRFVLVGAVLPDIIDKPIGMFLLRNVFHNSRLFAHSLIFAILLISIGFYRNYKYKKNGILLLGIGSLAHQVLDSMWEFPKIALWPFLGIKFPPRAEGSWVSDDFTRLISDPICYGPELIGFIIILYFFVKLIRNKGIKEFLKTGRIQ
ncbi:metal-dependent hydrolase [Clostridium neuense]|uniref:Metal-dependent hydrolase n=1 Tax=Clostridium neuense TaxID=1728934 RepID=A0ABW8TH72_9CLOT